MKNWFQKLKEKLAKSMEGRYGFDELSMCMNMAGLVMIFLAYIPYMQWISIAAWGILIWAVVRAMSRNHTKRREELYNISESRKRSRTNSLYGKQYGKNVRPTFSSSAKTAVLFCVFQRGEATLL